ncbi:MAG: hypothetical protein AB8H03_16625 [Saprospiraceae bacterium]
MKKVLIYISLIVFAIGGCKKVDLDDVPSGDPVFTTSAELDGVQLNLVAGDDDFYMFSEFSKDNFDVYTMTGRFAKDTNCQDDCEESLSFSIRSSYIDSFPNQIFNIDQALVSNSNLNYFSDSNSNSIGYNYFFSAEYFDFVSASQADSFYWEISSDSFSFNTFSDSFSIAYLGNTDIDVRLEITSTGGCTSYIQKTIPLGLLDDCDLSVNIELDSFNVPIFFLTPSFVNNSTVPINWINFNNLNNDTLIFFLTTTIPPSGLFLFISSSGNQQCLVELGICPELGPNMGFPESFSFPKINYTVDSFSVGDPDEQLSAVTIEYQDATGTYSSEFADSLNSNSTFTITKIEEYDDNEIGEKTKKLTIEYNCILGKEGSGETKNIIGRAEIAVAYPD